MPITQSYGRHYIHTNGHLLMNWCVVFLLCAVHCKFRFVLWIQFRFRFAGFSPLLVSSCNETDGDIRVIHLNDALDLDAFLNPVALLLCYYVLAIASKFILDAKVTIFESFFIVLRCHPINVDIRRSMLCILIFTISL